MKKKALLCREVGLSFYLFSGMLYNLSSGKTRNVLMPLVSAVNFVIYI